MFILYIIYIFINEIRIVKSKRSFLVLLLDLWILKENFISNMFGIRFYVNRLYIIINSYILLLYIIIYIIYV